MNKKESKTFIDLPARRSSFKLIPIEHNSGMELARKIMENNKKTIELLAKS